MAKRLRDASGEDEISIVEISGGMIKGYHEFGIKLPIGCKVAVERETTTSDAKDEYALLCKVPRDLDSRVLDMVMVSKSKKRQYKVRDVVGKTIGRVQYFLNKTFVELTEEGRVKCIEGCITGDPTASKQPPQKQKWVKNRRAGGGAVLPCRWLLSVPKGMEGRVVDILNARLPDVEGHEAMSVKVLQLAKQQKLNTDDTYIN